MNLAGAKRVVVKVGSALLVDPTGAPDRAWLHAFASVCVLVTGGLFFDLPLPLAVIGHEGGTVLVVLNGLRLLSDRIRSGDGNARAHRQPNPPAPASSALRSETTSPTAP